MFFAVFVHYTLLQKQHSTEVSFRDHPRRVHKSGRLEPGERRTERSGPDHDRASHFVMNVPMKYVAIELASTPGAVILNEEGMPMNFAFLENALAFTFLYAT